MVDFPSSSWIKNGKNSSKFTTKSIQSKRKTGGGMNHLNIHNNFRFLWLLKIYFFLEKWSSKIVHFFKHQFIRFWNGQNIVEYLNLQLRKWMKCPLNQIRHNLSARDNVKYSDSVVFICLYSSQKIMFRRYAIVFNFYPRWNIHDPIRSVVFRLI